MHDIFIISSIQIVLVSICSLPVCVVDSETPQHTNAPITLTSDLSLSLVIYTPLPAQQELETGPKPIKMKKMVKKMMRKDCTCELAETMATQAWKASFFLKEPALH